MRKAKDTTRLILIRHGETDYSLNRRYCGFSNPSLNKNGIKQIECLARRLKNFKIDRVYCSDLKRTYQSAKIIFPNYALKRSAALREIDFGSFEGLKFDVIARRYPKVYFRWLKEPFKVKIPKGESLLMLQKRVMKMLGEMLLNERSNTVAIVTHGGPIRVILYNALKCKDSMFFKIEQNLAALNIVDFCNCLPKKVIKINDTRHLK